MHIHNTVLLVMLPVLFIHITYPYDAVTFELNGGRFGDNLISCSQAYWIHHAYNIPLLFKPFTYSDQLKIHYDHLLWEQRNVQGFKNVIYLTLNSSVLDKRSTGDNLYITTFTKDPGVDWSDVAFVEKFREAISPIDTCWQYRKIPSHVHSIAIHIRRGGSFSYDKKIYSKVPQQFPSLAFYIQALRLLLRHLDGPCNVYLFTDDNKPKKLAKRIRRNLLSEDQERVTIVYQDEKNNYIMGVLSDFFDMMQCKYLIRPCSHFSLFVEQLGTCAISISPSRAKYRKKKRGYVTEMCITTFIEGESRSENIIVDENLEHKNIPILQTAESKSIFFDPLYRSKNRCLQSKLRPCY